MDDTTPPPAPRRRDLATALREALELVPWSLRSVAKAVGRSHATVAEYKTGVTPTPETLEHLGRLLEERGRALLDAGRELQRYAARRQPKGDTGRLNAEREHEPAPDAAPGTERLNAERADAPAPPRLHLGPLLVVQDDDAEALPPLDFTPEERAAAELEQLARLAGAGALTPEERARLDYLTRTLAPTPATH